MITAMPIMPRHVQKPLREGNVTQKACLVAFVTATTALLTARTATAGDICWIDTITKTQSGVELRLSQSASASIRSPDQPLRFLDVRPSLPPDSQNKTLPIVSSIRAKLGDEILLRGGAHDSCRLHVATMGNKIGILAYYSNTAPGLPPNSGSKFIVAQ